MWDNDYKEPSRKASGAWGHMMCLQQPWESSLETPLKGLGSPTEHRAAPSHQIWQSPLKLTPMKDFLVAKLASRHLRERNCIGKHLTEAHSPLHQLWTVMKFWCKTFVFKKMKLNIFSNLNNYMTLWNCQPKEKINPKSLCRPLKCRFGSLTSYQKPIVEVPSFCQKDLGTDESILKTNSNEHPRSWTPPDQDFSYKASSCSAQSLLSLTITFMLLFSTRSMWAVQPCKSLLPSVSWWNTPHEIPNHIHHLLQKFLVLESPSTGMRRWLPQEF